MRRLPRLSQRSVPTFLAFPAVAVLGIALGVAGSGFFQPDDRFFALKKNFTIFGQLYETLAEGYVDPVDAEQLMRTGIDAMLQTLDPYTVFIDEADNEDIDIMTRGRYGGVGLQVGQRAGRVTVLAPFEGYSGYEQGVKAGDVLIEIDGQRVEEVDQDAIGGLLRGAPGSTVDVKIERVGEPGLLDFTLTRSEVQLDNVTYSGFAGDPEAGIGYVRLERFARSAAPQLKQAIDELSAERELQGFILDLRGNPGGLLEAAVDVSGYLMAEPGPVVSTRGRLPESERVYTSSGPPALGASVPVAVLIDGGSASASEIVAGAIQDTDRGVLVGQTTFGKGLVQIIRPLPYNTSIKLTTAKYYTPSGRLIQSVTYSRDEAGGRAVAVADSLRREYLTSGGRPVYDGHGIEPDVEVGLGDGSDLEQSLVRSAAFFLYANRYAADYPALPEPFAVTDRTLQDFRAFVASSDLDLDTRAERALEALAQDLADAGYDETADEIDALRREIDRELDADFERHAARLKERLRQQILARYIGQKAQVAASLEDDPQLLQAVALLQDDAAYRAVLAKPE